MVSSLQKAVRTAIVDFTAKSEPLSLRANFSWTFIGSAVYGGSQWGILIVLAKLTTPEAVGRFALGLAVCAPVIMFTGLDLGSVQATDARREYSFADYLSLRLVMTMLALAIIAIIGLVSGYGRETAIVVLLVGLSKAVEAISDIYYGLFQQRERMDRMAISRMIKGPLSLLALGSMVYFTHSIAWGVVGLVAAWTALLLFYDIPNGHAIQRNSVPDQGDSTPAEARFHLSRHLPTLWELAWLAAPLGIVMTLISLNTNIPRYAIERYLGERDLGIFAAMAYLIVAGQMVVGALGLSTSPRLAQHYADKNEKAFRGLLLKLTLIGVIIGLAGIAVALLGGKALLTLLYKPEYADHSDVFVWIMIAGGIGYTSEFLGYVMTAVRLLKVRAILSIVVVTSTAVASWILIPSFGLVGGAMTLVVSAIVRLLGSSAIILHALNKLRT
jgi:O-antigen/teichoic acid export membrane protein